MHYVHHVKVRVPKIVSIPCDHCGREFKFLYFVSSAAASRSGRRSQEAAMDAAMKKYLRPVPVIVRCTFCGKYPTAIMRTIERPLRYLTLGIPGIEVCSLIFLISVLLIPVGAGLCLSGLLEPHLSDRTMTLAVGGVILVVGLSALLIDIYRIGPRLLPRLNSEEYVRRFLTEGEGKARLIASDLESDGSYRNIVSCLRAAARLPTSPAIIRLLLPKVMAILEYPPERSDPADSDDVLYWGKLSEAVLAFLEKHAPMLGVYFVTREHWVTRYVDDPVEVAQIRADPYFASFLPLSADVRAYLLWWRTEGQTVWAG